MRKRQATAASMLAPNPAAIVIAGDTSTPIDGPLCRVGPQQEKLEYVADLIGELRVMARDAGYNRLARLLAEADEEAQRRLFGKVR